MSIGSELNALTKKRIEENKEYNKKFFESILPGVIKQMKEAAAEGKFSIQVLADETIHPYFVEWSKKEGLKIFKVDTRFIDISWEK